MSEFANLKPGDDIIVTQHLNGARVEKVARITKTGRIVVIKKNCAGQPVEEVFEPSGGLRGYNGYRRPHLELATPERLAAIRTVQNRERLKRADWDTLPADFVNTVAYYLDNINSNEKH